MDNSDRNFPERLGYCFHSNGFKKTSCILQVCRNAFKSLSMQNYDGKLLDGGQNNKSSI